MATAKLHLLIGDVYMIIDIRNEANRLSFRASTDPSNTWYLGTQVRIFPTCTVPEYPTGPRVLGKYRRLLNSFNEERREKKGCTTL